MGGISDSSSSIIVSIGGGEGPRPGGGPLGAGGIISAIVIVGLLFDGLSVPAIRGSCPDSTPGIPNSSSDGVAVRLRAYNSNKGHTTPNAIVNKQQGKCL